jgi:eukaryotic-like serine/threonine-protein kinase
MVQIPPGTFTMGSPAGEAQRDKDESPQHQVTVPGFFMGKYEVTQAQYQAIMGNNPSRFKGDTKPVENVSWDDAVEFCQKLSQKTGRKYRLPSEAEWEYACRAGTTTPFYFGETITTDLVNYDGNYPYASAPKGQYRQETTDVGKFLPNPFGLYDMHGNIWEWCEDVYNENYQSAPRDGSAWLTGKNNNTKMLRGGAWDHDAWYCRSALRLNYAPANRNFDVGFRVVAVAVA